MVEHGIVEPEHPAEEDIPVSAAETLMNSAEAIVGELVPGQEPLQHVDDTPPSAVVADDAPAASQQDLVDLPVAEATEISDQTVLAAEEPIPSVSEKSDVDISTG